MYLISWKSIRVRIAFRVLWPSWNVFFFHSVGRWLFAGYFFHLKMTGIRELFAPQAKDLQTLRSVASKRTQHTQVWNRKAKDCLSLGECEGDALIKILLGVSENLPIQCIHLRSEMKSELRLSSSFHVGHDLGTVSGEVRKRGGGGTAGSKLWLLQPT